MAGRPLLPIAGIALSVAVVASVVALTGENASSNSDEPAAAAATTAPTPAVAEPTPTPLPARGTCQLTTEGKVRKISVTRARTLTQIAAVGWQVKAPAEMMAWALDTATQKPKIVPSVTDALDLYTRGDLKQPSPRSMSDLAALANPGALTCIFAQPVGKREKAGENGLTARADTVRIELRNAFGNLKFSGFGKTADKQSAIQTAGRGLLMRLPSAFRAEDGSWVLSHWLIARGSELRLGSVASGAHVWTPTAGWAPKPAVTSTTAGNRVYVTVVSGGAAKAATPKSGPAAKASTRKK